MLTNSVKSVLGCMVEILHPNVAKGLYVETFCFFCKDTPLQFIKCNFCENLGRVRFIGTKESPAEAGLMELKDRADKLIDEIYRD